MRKLLSFLLVMLALPLAAQKANAPATPKTNAKPLTFSKPWYGQASWYGAHWDGRKTACGQLFDSTKLTAAHPHLPCGTTLRVTNVRTQHATFVTVTDRGPYEEGREIDVAEAAAKRIDIKKWGVERVKIEIVKK
jgi:rare lipoprotein A (peptidoglycan hydrolase)